jgi:hypothetical protein
MASTVEPNNTPAKNRGISVYSTNATLVTVKNTVKLTSVNFWIKYIPVKIGIYKYYR